MLSCHNVTTNYDCDTVKASTGVLHQLEVAPGSSYLLLPWGKHSNSRYTLRYSEPSSLNKIFTSKHEFVKFSS